MSEIIKLNMKKKKFKAIIPDEELSSGFDSYYEENSIKKELEQKYNIGFEEGYNKAKEELEETFVNQLVEKSENFYKILSSFEEKLIDYEKSFDKLVLAFTKSVSKKVLKREVEIESPLGEVIREASTKVLGANDVVIKLNPDDYNEIAESDFSKRFAGNFQRIKFEEDNKIEKGGCIIETEIGNVDARLGTQVDEIITAAEIELIQEEE
jgi:flagellar assembly protein FliH